MLVCKHGAIRRVRAWLRQTVVAGRRIWLTALYAPQGDVELMAQGEDNVVQDFLDEIGRRMARYIRQCVETDEPIGSFDGFDIRY